MATTKTTTAPAVTDEITASRSIFSLIGNTVFFLNKRISKADKVCEALEDATIDCVNYGATSLKSAIPQAE